MRDYDDKEHGVALMEGMRSGSRTRRLGRGLALTVIVGLGALLPMAAPASAATFTNSTSITSPGVGMGFYAAANPYPSSINVSGLTGSVTDLNVTLCGFSATFPSDVDLMLVAPNGTAAIIMSDVGGNGGQELADPDPAQWDVPVTTPTNITLDDAAANRLPVDSALTGGTYRPVDDDTDELDLNNINTDVFPGPAPLPTDRVGVFRPSTGTWFFRSDTDNVQLSAFNGLNPNGEWKLYMVDDWPGASGDGEAILPTLSCGWSLDITGGGSGLPPGNGTVVAWGANGDIPVPGDYDGNGSIDIAVYRPSVGVWFVQNGPTVSWGAPGDIPVPGDYDGDGDTDVAVFRPSSGAWFVHGGATVIFGTNGDVPVPADYDGDDDTDVAVFRPSNGTWFINGPLASPSVPTVVQYGTNGDIPVPGDYDRLQGTANIAVFRPSTGTWFIQGGGVIQFGTNGDIPVPHDYNADGFVDVGVFRPSTGTWFTQGGAPFNFGTAGDVPLLLPPPLKVIFFP